MAHSSVLAYVALTLFLGRAVDRHHPNLHPMAQLLKRALATTNL